MQTMFPQSQVHMTQTSIFQKFLDDPRTVSMRDRHIGSLHLAVIVKRGKILAEAVNNFGSRARGSGYSKSSIHAEKNVIKNLGDISKIRGADMYVMRFSRSDKDFEEGKFMCSKPCPSCSIFLEKCMREYGLKNVFYTS
jgi:hypothetical protein